MPVARLDSRALIAVTGPDARAFLHGLLTQDVETLAPGELRYGALLGPQGRLLFDLFLFGTDDGVLIDCVADRRPALLQRLGLYRLRAKVELTPDDRPVFAAWGDGQPSWPVDPRLPALGRRAVAPERTADASEADWRRHQVAFGFPDAADFAPDADYPIECNLDLLNGIDFQKGCFIGQETTSRMKRRGTIKTRLVPITFDGPPPRFGAEILNGDLRAGEVRGGVEGRAMALLRLDRMTGRLTIDGREARADPPAWLGLAGA
jgi:folate-binding protein YgfZ